MRRAALLLFLAMAVAPLLSAPAGAATSVAARYQLRGHLPELGERPTIRVFATQAAYDAYRASLGEANIFPPASSLFMSFDRDILALYIRGNDSGGRCFGTTPTASLDGDTVTLGLSWQSGTCGAPSTAHYPFILVALSRTAADGTTWPSPSRSVCGSAPDVANSLVCATVSGTATAAPTATATPAAPTATPTAPAASPTRTLTPTVPAATSPVAVASPTIAPTAAPTRSPAAAASPSPAADGNETNYLLYGMLIAAGFLVGIALMVSRGGRSRRMR